MSRLTKCDDRLLVKLELSIIWGGAISFVLPTTSFVVPSNAVILFRARPLLSKRQAAISGLGS